MFSAVAPALRRAGPSIKPTIRSLATVIPDANSIAIAQASTTTATASKPDGPPLRPQPDVEIDPNHGLWAFFRKDKNGKLLTLEPAHKTEDFSGQSSCHNVQKQVAVLMHWPFSTGRAWHAVELRRKSFKDLHVLWYACLRERNLLVTQMAEFRRVDVSVDLSNVKDKERRVSLCRFLFTPLKSR